MSDSVDDGESSRDTAQMLPLVVEQRDDLLRLVNGSPFLTLQGEGVLTGTPSVFVRLAGCDLRCTRMNGRFWSCDTPESLNDFDYKRGVWRPTTPNAYQLDIKVLAQVVCEYGCPCVVITGGEPTLQAVALCYFLENVDALGVVEHVTLETNCRRFEPALAEFITLPSLSPKLQFWTDLESNVLEQWLRWGARTGNPVQIKIVCSDSQDVVQALNVFDWAGEFAEIHAIIQPSWLKDERKADRDRRLKVMAEIVTKHGCARMMLQSHKLIGVP